jgi:vacuolar-type H+-ATPase subunit H
VGNLGKTNSATNTKISVAKTYYNSWTEEQNKIDELTKQLATVSSDAKSEWQSQVDLYNKLTPEEQKDKVAAAQWYVYYGKVHAAIGSSETAIKNGGKTLDKYIAYLQKDLDSQLDEANAALKDVKAAAAEANPNYHSYIALKTAQTTLEADKIANSGSQASFEIFANLLHVNVEGFRTVMLLILSLLIELTIYQTSPKVQINRRMLYQFTEYLPAIFVATTTLPNLPA